MFCPWLITYGACLLTGSIWQELWLGGIPLTSTILQLRDRLVLFAARARFASQNLSTASNQKKLKDALYNPDFLFGVKRGPKFNANRSFKNFMPLATKANWWKHQQNHLSNTFKTTPRLMFPTWPWPFPCFGQAEGRYFPEFLTNFKLSGCLRCLVLMVQNSQTTTWHKTHVNNGKKNYRFLNWCRTSEPSTTYPWESGGIRDMFLHPRATPFLNPFPPKKEGYSLEN